MESDIVLYQQWLNENKQLLKVLLFIGNNINENNMCRCKLKYIHEWSKVSNKNIRTSLKELKEKKYIKYNENEDKATIFNISIDIEEMKESNKIEGIHTQWVNEIKQANKDVKNNNIDKKLSVDWTWAFKILVHSYIGSFKSVQTQEEIGKVINTSRDTVNDALKLLDLCEFENIKFIHETVKRNVLLYDTSENTKEWVKTNMGTHLNIGIQFLNN